MAPLSGQLATNSLHLRRRRGPGPGHLAGNDRALSTQLDEAARSDRTGRTSSGTVVNGAAADTNGLALFTNTPPARKHPGRPAPARRPTTSRAGLQNPRRADGGDVGGRWLRRPRRWGAGSGSPFGGGSGLSMPLNGVAAERTSGALRVVWARRQRHAPDVECATGRPRAAGEPGRRQHCRQSHPGPAATRQGPENGLQKFTVLTNRAVSAAFPQIREIGGVRADSLKWHPNGSRWM